MTKRIISLTLAIVFIFTLCCCGRNKTEKTPVDSPAATNVPASTPQPTEEPVEETEEDLEFEQEMWNYLIEQYHNPVSAAVIMANAHCESTLCPYRFESDLEKDENGEYPMSKRFLERLDSGEIDRLTFAQNEFGPGGWGFGLFAWTDDGRKMNLYDFAKERGVSLGDWQMQLDFVYEEIVERYYKLFDSLYKETDLHDSCDRFMGIYEKASRNDRDGASNKRWMYTREYFNRFAGEEYVYESSFDEYDLLPVYGSYDYLDYVSVGKEGDEGNIYAYMAQLGLTRLGYLGGANGVFGDLTEKAVISFQEDYGLDPTGVVGPEEWAILAQDNLNRNVEEIWNYPK